MDNLKKEQNSIVKDLKFARNDRIDLKIKSEEFNDRIIKVEKYI
jgi:hypothetical protein